MIRDTEGFGPDAVDVLEILYAARVEIGRRLVEAFKAGDMATVAVQQRRLRHACDAVLAVQRDHTKGERARL